MSRRFLIVASLVLIRAVNLFAQNSGDFEGKKAGDRRELAPGIFFRWCPAGTFKMGKDIDESEFPLPAGVEVKPMSVSGVELTSGYWLAETEVTQGHWQKVMGTTPWKDQKYVKEGADIAANYISHNDAMSFCKDLTKQERDAGRLPESWRYLLPTEAQWEYACRAGTTSKFCFGDNESKLSEYSWWGGLYGNGNAKTEKYAHRVGQKRPNKWGLKDIHGNVAEWCLDGFHVELPGGQDPFGPTCDMIPVIRGGSWVSIVGLGSADRTLSGLDSRLEGDGFRPAAVSCSVFAIGETVVAIHDAELHDEGKVVGLVWPGLTLKITAINGDRLQASDYSTGWIDRIHLASLERGIHVLTERIKRNPDDPNLYTARASVWLTKQDFDKAIADYDEALRLNPINAAAYGNRGYSHQKTGDYDKAIADYVESIKMEPKTFSSYNSLAWLYATCPDQKYRDGKKAVELATQACELTQWKDAQFIDTLAAAFAENGDWDNAVKRQEQFIEMINDEKEKQVGRVRLELYYKNRKPFRDDP